MGSILFEKECNISKQRDWQDPNCRVSDSSEEFAAFSIALQVRFGSIASLLNLSLADIIKGAMTSLFTSVSNRNVEHGLSEKAWRDRVQVTNEINLGLSLMQIGQEMHTHVSVLLKIVQADLQSGNDPILVAQSCTKVQGRTSRGEPLVLT
jgi:hypothetical protein